MQRLSILDSTILFLQLRDPSRFSPEGKFSLSNVHPCLLHLADGFHYMKMLFTCQLCNLERHQLKFQPMYFHPTSQRLTREKIPPLTFSHTGSTCLSHLSQFILEIFNETINGFRHCFETRIVVSHNNRCKVLCTINIYVHATQTIIFFVHRVFKPLVEHAVS